MRLYNDPSKARELAKLNGIQNPNRILAGKTLNLPTTAQMRDMTRNTSSFDKTQRSPPPVDITGGGRPSPAAPAAASAAPAAAAPAATAPAPVGPAINIEKLAADGKEASEPTISKSPPKVFTDIDESGTTKDGKIQISEAEAFLKKLDQRIAEATTPAERKALELDKATVANLVNNLSWNLNAPKLAARIDKELTYDGTNKPIGDGDGLLSKAEVEAFIADRLKRNEGEEAARNNNAYIMQLAQGLLKRMPE